MENTDSNIYKIKMKNNREYTVRKDRHRYFFPNEWNLFMKQFKNEKNKLFFITLLNTGARVMEALHFKPKNFDYERSTVTLDVIKQRKAKKQFSSLIKSRTFFVSKTFLKEVNKYVKKNNINDNDYIFMDNKKLPANYDNMTNAEKNKHFIIYKVNYSSILKRKLIKAGIKDYYNFSLHNIRKTYGNWMRIYDIRTEELCYRLGHDYQTFMIHYGSSLIFTPQEKLEIMNILGDVK